MNRKDKELLIKEIKELERIKYSTIQKINKIVFALEKILTEA